MASEPTSSGTSPGLNRLDNAGDLGRGRAALIRLAGEVDHAVVLAMLAEALVQIERIGPRVSGEAWEAYLAVERAADEAGVTGTSPPTG